jgi:hypothetical protein
MAAVDCRVSTIKIKRIQLRLEPGMLRQKNLVRLDLKLRVVVTRKARFMLFCVFGTRDASKRGPSSNATDLNPERSPSHNCGNAIHSSALLFLAYDQPPTGSTRGL